MSAQSVANYFLDQAEREGIPITPMKLVKLVYIAYGWTLAVTGNRLFEEPIQAWQHGPVVPSIYHEFKHFGNSAINVRSYDLNPDSFELYVPRIDKNDKDTNLVLSKVWATHKGFRAWDLRNLTHKKGSPWNKVYVKGQKHICLDDGHIHEYYTKRIGEYIEKSK